MSVQGHKPRRRSGPGAGLCPHTSNRVGVLCTAAKEANASNGLTHRSKNRITRSSSARASSLGGGTASQAQSSAARRRNSKPLSAQDLSKYEENQTPAHACTGIVRKTAL